MRRFFTTLCSILVLCGLFSGSVSAFDAVWFDGSGTLNVIASGSQNRDVQIGNVQIGANNYVVVVVDGNGSGVTKSNGALLQADEVVAINVGTGSGNDEIDLSLISASEGWNLSGVAIYAQNGLDVIFGSQFGDFIDGGGSMDWAEGLGGNDSFANVEFAFQ